MSEFTPLSQLSEIDNPRVDWRLKLPDYVPADEVGVNLRAVSRGARLAGYGHLVIRGEDMGVTKTTPGVDGINSDGSASLSGSGTLTTPETVKSSALTGKELGCEDTMDAYHWRTGGISINTEAMADKLSRMKNGSLRSKVAWSKELNGAIRRGMNEAAVEGLIRKSSAQGFAYTGFFFLGGEMTDALYDNLTVQDTVINYALASGFFAVRAAVGGHFKDRRLSLLPAYQVDRLLVARGLSSTTRFSKPLSA
jgi:hypothetical protein